VAQVVVAGDGTRSTIDPDDFSGGFGIWSGTSFAAPILAGEIAQALFTSDTGLADYSCEAALARCWLALSSTANQHRPAAT
jgi:subtilisin family serine protease